MQRQPTSGPKLAAPLPLLSNDTLQVLLCPEACLRAVVSLSNLDNHSNCQYLYKYADCFPYGSQMATSEAILRPAMGVGVHSACTKLHEGSRLDKTRL